MQLDASTSHHNLRHRILSPPWVDTIDWVPLASCALVRCISLPWVLTPRLLRRLRLVTFYHTLRYVSIVAMRHFHFLISALRFLDLGANTTLIYLCFISLSTTVCSSQFSQYSYSSASHFRSCVHKDLVAVTSVIFDVVRGTIRICKAHKGAVDGCNSFKSAITFTLVSIPIFTIIQRTVYYHHRPCC